MQLERALVTVNFLDIFKDTKLINPEVTLYDKLYQYAKMFHFENSWIREAMCSQIMDEVWSNNQEHSLYEKLYQYAEVLEAWSQDIAGSFKKRINECEEILNKFKRRRDQESIRIVGEVKKNLAEIYTQHKFFWRQRSKQIWLREGNRNSRFFHAATKNRRKINKIDSLYNADGIMVEWGSELEDTMAGYLSTLFTASTTD